MININLKPGQKRAKAGGPSLGGGVSALRELTGNIKDPWPMAAIVAWVLALGFLAWVGVGSSMQISRLEPELDQARSENRRHRQFLAQKRKAEAARDSIVAQISAIRRVDGERYVYPHILDEVTRALPPWTWLTGVSTLTSSPADSGAVAPDARIQMRGRTMDIQGMTRFMRQLEDSPFLADVIVLASITVVEAGRAVTEFTLQANFSRPGQSHIRTTTVTPARGG